MALSSDRVDLIRNFVQEGIDLQRGRIEAESDPFWKRYVRLVPSFGWIPVILMLPQDYGLMSSLP